MRRTGSAPVELLPTDDPEARLYSAVGASFPSDPALNDPFWDLATIKAYHYYAAKHIFDPSHAKGSFDHPPADALAYQFPPSGNGWNSGDLKEICGAAGWHFSVDHPTAFAGATTPPRVFAPHQRNRSGAFLIPDQIHSDAAKCSQTFPALHPQPPHACIQHV